MIGKYYSLWVCFFCEIRGVKFIWKKIRGLKIYSEKIRGLKILGFSEENTPGGYSPLKMTTPLDSSSAAQRQKHSPDLDTFCWSNEVDFPATWEKDKPYRMCWSRTIFRWTKFSASAGNSGSFIRRKQFYGFIFCISTYKILYGQKFSVDKIFGSKPDFRHFFPPKFCPISKVQPIVDWVYIIAKQILEQ